VPSDDGQLISVLTSCRGALCPPCLSPTDYILLPCMRARCSHHPHARLAWPSPMPVRHCTLRSTTTPCLGCGHASRDYARACCSLLPRQQERDGLHPCAPAAYTTMRPRPRAPDMPSSPRHGRDVSNDGGSAKVAPRWRLATLGLAGRPARAWSRVNTYGWMQREGTRSASVHAPHFLLFQRLHPSVIDTQRAARARGVCVLRHARALWCLPLNHAERRPQRARAHAAKTHCSTFDSATYVTAIGIAADHAPTAIA
jgi:hypothetical protein